MKKILFITPGYMPINNSRGGAIESLIKTYFLHNNVSKKYRITAYSSYDKNERPDESAQIEFRNINLSNHARDYRHMFRRLLNILFGLPCARYYIKQVISDLEDRNETETYDLIIIENCVNDLAWIGKNLRTRTPIVLHLHNDYLYKGRRDAKKATEFLTQVWCVSDYLKQRVDKINPESAKTITVYNTIDFDAFNKKISDSEKTTLKNKLQISENDYIFLFVGRIMPEKGVLPMIKSFNIINKTTPSLKLIIIGDKKTKNAKDTYFNKVKTLIRKNPNIIQLGSIKHDELYTYYQMSDCQIIPSTCQEAFGLIALEGMKNSIIIIATESGGLPEVLEDYDIRIKKATTKELIHAMDEAIALGKTRHKKVNLSRFSKENYCHAIDQVIDSVTSGRKKNG